MDQSRALVTVRQRLPARSEGVRMPFGRLKEVQKVIGVGSLSRFMNLTYNQLAEKLAQLIGQTYSKSTLGTWALVERRKRLTKAWYKKYWMPAHVEDAFKQMLRDYIHWITDGRYAVRITGMHRWRVTLKRV